MTRNNRALKALAERRQDPLSHYKPSRPQAIALKSKTRYRITTGINQSGKTALACVEMAHTLRGTSPWRENYPGGRYLCMAPTRAQAATIQGHYLLEACEFPGAIGRKPLLDSNEVDVEWDRSAKPNVPRVITHRKTGKVLYFGWSGMAHADEVIQGRQFDGVWIDETAGDQDLLDELMPRLLRAQSDPDRPDGGFLHWTVTMTKINPAVRGLIERARDPAMEDYALYELPPGCNPAISDAVRDQMALGMSEKARRIRMEGTATAEDMVLIYPQLRESPERWVRTEPYQPASDDNYWVSYDPGVAHPTALLIAAVNRLSPMRLNLLHCIYGIRMTIEDEIEQVRQWLAGRKLAGFTFDHQGAGKQEKGTGKSVIQQVFERMDNDSWWAGSGRPRFQRVKQNRDHGISMVRSYLDPPKDVYPEPMLQCDPPSARNGLDRWLAEMQMYRGREDLDFVGPKGVYNKQDDCCDATRYLCLCQPLWQDFGPNVAKGARQLATASLPAPPPNIPMSPEQWRLRDQTEKSRKLARSKKRFRASR